MSRQSWHTQKWNSRICRDEFKINVIYSLYINHNKGLIMKLIDEPTNEQIDDYNNNESPEKRKTVRIIIATLILVGVVSYMVLS